MKISSSLLHILCDLLAQCLDRRKLNFVAKPVEKGNLDFALRRQLDGMKIEQVRLDRKRLGSKRRRLPTFVTESKHSVPTRVHVM